MRMISPNDHKESLFGKAKTVYQAQADKIASSRTKLARLLQKATEKLNRVSEIPAVKESQAHLEIIFRMVKAHINHEYKGFSNRTMGLFALGLLYFILPVDFIPDFIPVIGYVDDLTVLMAIFKSINSDVEKFLEWERTKG